MSRAPIAGINAEAQLAIGREQMREGDKQSTGGWFRRVDWEAAAVAYEKAATAFRVARDSDSAREAYKKAAAAKHRLGLVATATQLIDKAGVMAQEAGDVADAVQQFQTEADWCRETGNGERAAGALAKAAKCLESNDAARASQLYAAALDLFEVDDKQAFSGQVFRDALGHLAAQQDWAGAIAALRKQAAVYQTLKRPHEVHRCYLAIIGLSLRLTDFVAADKAYHEALGLGNDFPTSDECRLTASLLEAWERGDAALLEQTLASQTINFLEARVARAIRGLRLPGSGSTAAASSSTASSAAGGASSSSTTTTAGSVQLDRPPSPGGAASGGGGGGGVGESEPGNDYT